jgi:hypothetical protein
LSIEKRRGQVRIVNDFHYFARADAHAIGIGGGGSTGGIHSLSPVVAFADAVRVRPSSPCDRTIKGVPSLITNSNLEPADKVPASFMPPRAAGPGLKAISIFAMGASKKKKPRNEAGPVIPLHTTGHLRR